MTQFFSVFLEYLGQSTIFLFLISLILFLFVVKQIFDQYTLKKQIELLKKEKDDISFKMQIQEKMLFLQSRQASVGELIGNISHQWKEPLGGLGAILSNLHATLLLKGEVSNEKLSDSIEKSYKILYYLSDTIATFYRFFKVQRSDKNDFNLYEEISNIALMVSYSMKVEQISLKFDCDKSFFLHGDRSEFANVILNIILNAKDILIERKIKEPLIELNVLKDDENIIITIQDNGGGIYQEPIEKIFEYSVSSKENSTGIGLFIVKNIIENRMKGHIKVQNNAYGALFTITLPITSNTIDVTSILAYDVEESAYDKIARLEKEVAKQSEVEKALRQWQDIFTQTHWGVAVHKGTSNHFEMVNPAFCKMYGYSAKELNEIIIPDIVAPEYLDMWSVKQKEAFDKSFVSFEAVNIRKDGSKFPVNVDLTVIKNEYDEILYYIANVRDITVKKEIADSLKKSEEAFRAMVENSPDVIMRYDRDYRRTYINPIGLLLMGKSESELLGKTPREFSPLPNLEEFEKAFYTVITEAKEVKIEGEFIIPNGERRWGEQRIVPELNQYGEVVSVLVIGRDITELRKANKELLFKNFAMENVNESIFLVDETGKFKYVNQGACKALGYTNDELLLLSVGDIDPDWPNDRWPGYWEILKQEKTMTMELHHKRKDGSIFPVEVVANYIEYEGIGYNMGLVRDISERKNAENEIKEREEKFSKLFMSSPAAVSVTSIDRNMYLEVNDSFLYFTKYTRDEVVGKSSADLQLFANLDERAEFFRRVLEEGVVRGYEFEYRAKDGTTGYGIAYATLLNIQGERCVLAHSYDINATKQLELVSTAINSTSEAVYITDETFSIIYVNDGACKMLGYTKEELTSMRVYDVDVLYSLEDLSTIKETKRLNQQIVFETKHKRKNGTIIDVEIAGGSFSFHNKTVFVSVVKDITAKKEYEKQLHLLQTAINNASDAIYIIGDTREIKYVSDTSCKMLGYSVDEFLTMKVEDIDPYMSLDEIIGVREKVKDFNSTTFQTQHRTKNGNILNVEITVTKFIFNDTVLNLSIVKDITRQIRQEEEIRELNKTLEVKVLEKTKELEKALQFNESIINAIPDMLFEISKECVYLNIWARDEKLLAQQKEILLGKSFKDMLPPDAVAVSMKTMEEVDMYGSSLGNIYKLDFPDGEHWFELHTTKKEPEGTYLALVRDITERKKAQNALVELNATLEEKIEIRTIELRKALDFNESIINALPDLLFEIDINGVYLNLWARDEKLLAQQKEILLSKNVKDILSQESAQIVMQAILEAKENGFSFGKVLFINVQDDIKKFELSVSKKSDGHFLILSRDISSLR